MAAFSDYLENKILDHVLGEGLRNFTSPANLFIAISTADPLDAGTGIAEPSDGGYARQAVTFGTAAAGGSLSNTGTDVVFQDDGTGAGWGTITHMAIFDAATAGNMLFHGQLTNSHLMGKNDKLTFTAGQITCTAD